MIPPQTCLAIHASHGGRVQDYVAYVISDGTAGILTTVPTVFGEESPVAEGTKVICACSLQGEWHEFTSWVMGYDAAQPRHMVLAPPGQIKALARRTLARMQKEMAVTYAARTNPVHTERTTTVDISPDGLQIRTAVELPQGTEVALQLELPEWKLTLTGEVVWSASRDQQHFTGVQLRNVPPVSQQALSYYCYSMERERSARGFSIHQT